VWGILFGGLFFKNALTSAFFDPPVALAHGRAFAKIRKANSRFKGRYEKVMFGEMLWWMDLACRANKKYHCPDKMRDLLKRSRNYTGHQ
jgi:hypothetical protein